MIDKKIQGAGQVSVVPSSLRVLMPNGRVTEMRSETYLAGVVAMEIGSNAPLEALKAQAVASRTYAAAASRHSEKNADVCTTTHCQKWKRVDPIVAPEVFRAVSETWGVVATHEGKLIEAFFFEHCSGQTRNSEDMAMPELAYLRNVNCPCGFSDMRGHGVGLCQRGAIVLARNGASFEQILRHYYRGIAIVHTQREGRPLREQAEVKKGKEPRTKPSAPLAKPAKRAPVSSAPAQPATDSHEITTLIKLLRAQAAGSAPSTEKESVPEKSVPPPRMPQPTEHVSSVAPAVPDVARQETLTQPRAPAPEPLRPQPRIHVDNLPGPRMIAGCLARAGVVLNIEDMHGNKTMLFSGSAPHYGDGGFETIVEEDGYYSISIEDQVIEANVRGDTVFIRADSIDNG